MADPLHQTTDPRDVEIARLRREVADMRRALWCLAHQAGGEVSISVTSYARCRPEATLEVQPSPDGMRQLIRARSP